MLNPSHTSRGFRASSLVRRQAFRILLIGMSLGLGSTAAFSQSTQLTPLQQAVAAATADAVRQNDNELIIQEAFGNAGRGSSTSTRGPATVFGGLMAGSFATGRLRES